MSAQTTQNALRLVAGLGACVFPLRPGTKLPATKNGFFDASSDPEMVRAMFAVVGEHANLGVSTGASKLVVVDLDGETGVDCWRRLQAEHGQAPTLTSRTPRGWHLWFQAPDGVEVRNSASRIGPNVDVRGVGGYVVAPPSVVDGSGEKAGGSYRWARSSGSARAEVPKWLLPLMLPPEQKAFEVPSGAPAEVGDRYVDAAVRGEVTRVTSAVVGTRNVTLRAASYALGRLVGAGILPHGHAEQQLRAAGEAAGMGAVEVGRTVARGLRDGSADPRHVQRRAVAA